jgi:pilus assembly protein CpaB
MRRYGGVILLGLAVLMALFTSALLHNWLEQQRASLRPAPASPQAVHSPTETVVVATVDLFRGTTLTSEMIRLVSWPSESLPEGHISTVKDTEGRILITNIKANDPILASQLAPLDVTHGGMAAVTDPEKRAMAVRVDDVVGVAGFINPGNRVDVLVTLRQSPPKTKTVLQNVLVLATGTQMETQGNGAKPRPVRVITVEVLPEEAEKLALAANEGRVTMALRNYANTTPTLTSGATLASLLDSYRLQGARRKASSPALQTPPIQVELIKGETVQTLIFKDP